MYSERDCYQSFTGSITFNCVTSHFVFVITNLFHPDYLKSYPSFIRLHMVSSVMFQLLLCNF